MLAWYAIKFITFVSIINRMRLILTCVNTLSNNFNWVQHQTLLNIGAFEAVTQTFKGTLLSFLPWTDAYTRRCALAENFKAYHTLCHETLVLTQFLHQVAIKPLLHHGSKRSTPNDVTKINHHNSAKNLYLDGTEEKWVLKTHAEKADPKETLNLPSGFAPKISGQNSFINSESKNSHLNTMHSQLLVH